jgi:hypothetical protein
MYLHELLNINRNMKIRKGYWNNGLYIQKSDCGNYFIEQDNDDDIYDMFIDDILSNNWVKYTE